MLDALLSALPAAHLAATQAPTLPPVESVSSQTVLSQRDSVSGAPSAVSVPETIPLPRQTPPENTSSQPLKPSLPAATQPKRSLTIPTQSKPKPTGKLGNAIAAATKNRPALITGTQRTKAKPLQAIAKKAKLAQSKPGAQPATSLTSLQPKEPVQAGATPDPTSVPETTANTTLEAAKAERLKLLEQKLAEIVAREKPLKEERLRENLKATAIKQAEGGQIDQARETARDLVLSLEAQAELLTQINTIAARREQSAAPAKVPPTKAAATAHRSQRQTVSTGSPATSYVPSYVLPGGIKPPSFPALASNFRLLRPAWRLGNGNLRLIFPLPIPALFSSGFGWRNHPITGSQRFHRGVDLAAPSGTPVVAAFSGKVETADWMDGYGLTVILSHKQSTQTLYAHLSEIFVKPGDIITQGSPIGRVGSTGLSTGPHLHFELHQLTASGWEAFDPAIELEVAMTHLVKVMQIAQQLPSLQQGRQQPQIPALPQPFAVIPPPPTQKFSILHNF